MTFLQYLRQNDALHDENLVHPRLGDWIKKYIADHPLEQQGHELLSNMA